MSFAALASNQGQVIIRGTIGEVLNDRTRRELSVSATREEQKASETAILNPNSANAALQSHPAASQKTAASGGRAAGTGLAVRPLRGSVQSEPGVCYGAAHRRGPRPRSDWRLADQSWEPKNYQKKNNRAPPESGAGAGADRTRLTR
eukprot:617820-Hanusia_phi.AAC.1